MRLSEHTGLNAVGAFLVADGNAEAFGFQLNFLLKDDAGSGCSLCVKPFELGLGMGLRLADFWPGCWRTFAIVTVLIA